MAAAVLISTYSVDDEPHVWAITIGNCCNTDSDDMIIIRSDTTVRVHVGVIVDDSTMCLRVKSKHVNRAADNPGRQNENMLMRRPKGKTQQITSNN
jgi:hypothetical protein